MKWEYRRFKSYGEFVDFLNKISKDTNWNLHSWQDLRHGYANTDIRAVFTQVVYSSDSGAVQGELPEAK